MTWIFEVLVLVLFGASVWTNIFLLRRLLYVSDNINTLLQSIKDFSEHILKVNNLERYYGDEILINLLEHSRDMQLELDNFQEYYGEAADENAPAQTQEN
tara:strand:+ start:202 stop:501 length:300 start_codon:yes stop_codon:yes gene_type:complete